MQLLPLARLSSLTFLVLSSLLLTNSDLNLFCNLAFKFAVEFATNSHVCNDEHSADCHRVSSASLWAFQTTELPSAAAEIVRQSVQSGRNECHCYI
jgi:hypothetical protein